MNNKFIYSIDEWSYTNIKQWVRKNRYCAGHLQSPINLQYNISKYDHRLKRLQLEETHPRGKLNDKILNFNIHILSINRTSRTFQ